MLQALTTKMVFVFISLVYCMRYTPVLQRINIEPWDVDKAEITTKSLLYNRCMLPQNF